VFRHRFDPSSVVAALVFLGVAVRYLVEGFGAQRVSYPYAVPAVVISIALVVVLRLVFHSGRHER
jgi:ABC-type Fe3+ transport system permease subunit